MTQDEKLVHLENELNKQADKVFGIIFGKQIIMII